MFYLSENLTENFFNYQQWWKEMKKKMNPSKSTSAKSKAGTNNTKTYKLNCQSSSRVARDEAKIEINIEIN